MIPFINVRAQREAYLSEFKQAESEVLNSGCFIGGPVIQALESELAEFTGSKHTITCGSGTDALTIALLALGLKPGDEVIVPDFTFIAPAECVMRLGGIPKFADIDAETLQVSAESIESLIGEKTRGIIAVNLFGQCAPYAEIRKCALANGLWLIEDSAQAFGAMQNGIPACTFGDISITSFYPAKPLGCYGDGGALFTANDELAQRIRLIANHGSQMRYIHEICGMNSRLDAINTSTYAQYTVLAEDRATFLKQLESAGVPYCIHYPMPLHTQPCFKELAQVCESLSTSRDCASNATVACQKVVSLPMCAFTDVDEIIARLKKEM